jgi:exodeoxyribonuclease V beta subunit
MPSNDAALPIAFNAFSTALEPGINLIEASAGTGKTFSIAMLVLRFVVEHELPIEQVLVVTFTKAATQELRLRIRQRLQDLRRYLVTPQDPGNDNQDQAFKDWANSLPNPEAAANRVAQALASIDNAAIFTIHSFCQRMLRQYALESGQLFDAELNANVDQLRLALAEDYWRQQLYDASELKVSVCCAQYRSPAALLQSINKIQEGMVTEPAGLKLDDTLQQVETASEQLKELKRVLLTPLTTALAEHPANFKPAFVEKFPELNAAIEHWLDHPDSAIPVASLSVLRYDSLFSDALNGNKFRKTKLLAAEDRKRTFLSDYGITQTDALDSLLINLEQSGLAFRLGLLEYLSEHLQHSQSTLNVLSFNDLITRLSQVLQGEGGALLQSALQRKFKVALIDEFQDTDQQQWNIFSSVYNTEHHFLYLIGDPKQAIYKFRGADIYSYLEAKRAAHRSYTLDTNFRSHPALVNSVNRLFDAAENPFLLKEIPYYSVKAGKTADGFWWNDQPAQAMVLWCLEANPESAEGYWGSGVARQVLRVSVVNEIVALLAEGSGARLGKSLEASRAMRAQDIAILVRGNEEAANYQSALQQAGIAAVINSKQSVFESEEALHLQQLLTALIQPANISRVRQALALPWFGLDGQAFDALARDDHKLQQYVSDFQQFQQRWLERGLMAMMRSLLDQYQIPQQLAQQLQAERRITNLNHLLEILQQAVQDERLDSHKTLEWLSKAISERLQGEGKELRLEQDEAAVNIVTIHSSKGLEYPVVFCPELWSSKRTLSAPSGDKVVICHEGDSLIADLGSSKQTERFEQSLFEQDAEDLRLLYVAVTRAAYRCYAPWATVRTKSQDNTSAFAYLLKGYAGEDWPQKLQALANSDTGFEFAEIPAIVEPEQATTQAVSTEILSARTLLQPIKQRWQMSSYSALAYLSHQQHALELPQDKSQEPAEVPELVPEVAAEVLPKGAHTGNVLHDLLENHSFKWLAKLTPDIVILPEYESYVKSRERSCLRYGLVLEEEGYEALDSLLARSVAAPLDADDSEFYLANLDDKACLKEMPFYFTMNDLQTQSLNQLLAGQATCQPLSARTLSGQLTGFIDLICEYQGRYYVMDYKSNSLPDYDAESLQNAMREHNYGLQYFLYSVVLHHYLQQRLPGYDYDLHFGGVRYLFLRGMDAAEPMQGVFVDKPELELIEAISDVLRGMAA